VSGVRYKKTQKLNTETYIGMNNTTKNFALLAEIMKLMRNERIQIPKEPALGCPFERTGFGLPL
jgi:hypothetical protein